MYDVWARDECLHDSSATQLQCGSCCSEFVFRDSVILFNSVHVSTSVIWSPPNALGDVDGEFVGVA